MDSKRLFIGTAGWTVPKRYAGDFSPGGSHLVRYASRLNAVEINSSFYRPHRRATYERWAASVPAAFRFAVKLPKAITHARRLVGCEDLMDRFTDEVGGLGEKLAVLLVQLPPTLVYDGPTARAFFARLGRACAAAVVCEPRHASWFTAEADSALIRLQVARVAADPERVPGAGDPGGRPTLAYFRLHGSPRIYYSDYGAADLADLSWRIRGCLERGPVWCIFDNTAASRALGNALTMQGL